MTGGVAAKVQGVEVEPPVAEEPGKRNMQMVESMVGLAGLLEIGCSWGNMAPGAAAKEPVASAAGGISASSSVSTAISIKRPANTMAAEKVGVRHAQLRAKLAFRKDAPWSGTRSGDVLTQPLRPDVSDPRRSWDASAPTRWQDRALARGSLVGRPGAPSTRTCCRMSRFCR